LEKEVKRLNKMRADEKEDIMEEKSKIKEKNTKIKFVREDYDKKL